MIQTLEVNGPRTLTEDQIKEVEEAAKKQIIFDEDCPEMSPALMKAYKCAVAQRNRHIEAG